MSEVPHTTPTTRTTHTKQSLTTVATGRFEQPKHTVCYRTRIQKHRNREHVDVMEWKKYPDRGAYGEWSTSLVGGGGLFEREYRNRVFRAGVRAFEKEIKTEL